MRVAFVFFVAAWIGTWPLVAAPVTGRVIKVLPQLLDSQGRHALSPSLFERDAYQAQLQRGLVKTSGVRFAVQWKAKPAHTPNLRLRVEVVTTTTPRNKPIVIEHPVTAKSGWSRWTNLTLEGDAFKQAGEMISWRTRLLEGDTVLAEQHSFLW